jgi:hypothetical protein
MYTQETIAQQLSGTRLGSFFANNPAVAGLISALNSHHLPKQLQEYETIADLLSAMRTLSGVPTSPYDRAKYQIFGPDHKFLTIDDIPKPENYSVEDITKQLQGISQDFRQTALSGVSALDTFLQKDTSLFADTLGGVIDPEFVKKNFIFTEVVKSLTLEDIKSRPIEVAQKLTSYFVELYKPGL